MTSILNDQPVTISSAAYTSQNSSRAWSLSQPTPTSLRFEVRSGDQWTYDPATKNRSEIISNQTYPTGVQINAHYSLMLAPGPVSTASWMVFGQFHQTQNDGRSPPFEIDMDGGERLGISINYLTGSGAQAYKQLWKDAANIVRGQTYVWDIHATFSDTAGHLIVLRDGIQLVNYSGPMGFPNMGSVVWKNGIYRAASPETIVATASGLTITTGSVIAPSPPTSVADTYTTKAWAPNTLTVGPPGVLANDVGHNGQPLTATLSIGAAHGTLTLSPDGSFTYTPDAGYIGVDDFTYIASDGVTSGAPTVVTVTVS